MMKSSSGKSLIFMVITLALIAAGLFLFTSGRSMPVIALLDTGLDQTQINGKILDHGLEPWNMEKDNDDIRDRSPIKHGTMLARVIEEQGRGMVGILPIKITESGRRIRPEVLAKAISRAVSEKVDVINISSGIARKAVEIGIAIKEAQEAGIPVIAAAGKGIPNPYKPAPLKKLSPQAFPEVIVVGSARSQNDWDMTTNFGSEMDLLVVAPYKGQYLDKEKHSTGSSFAAAALSTYVALYRHQNRGWFGGHPSPEEIRAALRHSTSPGKRDPLGIKKLGINPSKILSSGKTRVPSIFQMGSGHLDLVKFMKLKPASILLKGYGADDERNTMEVVLNTSFPIHRASWKELEKWTTAKWIKPSTTEKFRYHFLIPKTGNTKDEISVKIEWGEDGKKGKTKEFRLPYNLDR